MASADSKFDGIVCSVFKLNNKIFNTARVDSIRFYLTIIPRARMGYESIDHEAEGRMVY